MNRHLFIKICCTIVLAWLVASAPFDSSAQNLVFPAHGITVAGSNVGQYGNTADKLESPTGIFVDDTGNLYVYDAGNNRVQKWAPGATSGITVAGGHGRGDSANQISYGIGLFVDTIGNVFVSDYSNYRVQMWQPGADTGITVAGGNGLGHGANHLNYPAGIWVTQAGYLYICDGDTIVQKWKIGAASGITVAGGHGRGNAANQLYGPVAICLDKDGAMYIGDMENNRVQKWKEGDTVGVTVAGGNRSGARANQLGAIEGLSMDSSGNLYISDTDPNSRIQRWAPGATTGTTVAGDSLSSYLSDFTDPIGVFLYNNRDLYICDNGHNRVLKYTGTPVGIATPEVNVVTNKLNVFPNPSNGAFTISGNISDALNGQSLSVSVTGIDGRLFYQDNIQVRDGAFLKHVDLKKLPNGVYTISLKNGQEPYSSTFIIQHD